MGGNYLPVNVSVKIADSIKRKKTDRLAHMPVSINDKGEVSRISYHGSAHIHALTKANGYITIPVGVNEIKAGEHVIVTLLT